MTKKISAIMLMLPDGRLVTNRRDKDAPTSPSLLSFFGGHIEDGETPIVAARRELQEETSIDITNLIFKPKLSLQIPDHGDASKIGIYFNLFSVNIESTEFKVYEGVGAESYSFNDLINQNDLSFTTRYALNELPNLEK